MGCVGPTLDQHPAYQCEATVALVSDVSQEPLQAPFGVPAWKWDQMVHAKAEKDAQWSVTTMNLLVGQVLRDYGFRVLERDDMPEIKRELKRQSDESWFDQTTTARMGRFLGSRYLVYVRYTDGYVMFQMLDLETAQRLSFHAVYAFDKSMREVRAELIQALNESPIKVKQ
jgi:hypothetical protein